MRPGCRIQRQLEQLEELLERSEVVRSMQQLPNSGPLLPRSTLESKPSLTKQYAVYWASACAPRACLRERGRCTATERRMIAASDVGTEVAEGIRGDAVLSSELMVLEAAEQDFELSSARRGSFVPLKQPLLLSLGSKPPAMPSPESPTDVGMADASPMSRTSSSTERPLDLALSFERMRISPLVPAGQGNAQERASALVAHILGVASAPQAADALVTQLRRGSGCHGKAHFVVHDAPLWLVIPVRRAAMWPVLQCGPTLGIPLRWVCGGCDGGLGPSLGIVVCCRADASQLIHLLHRRVELCVVAACHAGCPQEIPMAA
jgi:hypothetical protein